MKLRATAKAGGGLHITDENGKPIEGLEDAVLLACGLGDVPVISLRVRPSELVIETASVVCEAGAGDAPRPLVFGDVVLDGDNPNDGVSRD